MNQIVIYDYLGLDYDPLYIKLKQLKRGQKIDLGSITVLFNKLGIYEFISSDQHDGFKDIESCYKCLLKAIQEDKHACAFYGFTSKTHI